MINNFYGNTVWNDGIIKDVKDFVMGDKVNTSTTTNVNNQILTDEQWNVLIQFFDKRLRALEPESEAYNSCSRMYQTAKKKDASKLKEELKSAGSSVWQSILSAGVSTAVGHLLKLIIHAKTA